MQRLPVERCLLVRCLPLPNNVQTHQTFSTTIQHRGKHVTNGFTRSHHSLPSIPAMISHQTLYNLANSLGALAMITVVAYHFVAVNARYISANGQAGKN
ncbi:hypothetical protein F5J12DRAFT_513407 [Pisolithus orientalis]|uniref:uncharacterized protein n=1 Tax=Pisolithus orientalis TaxID=936130 RepID=UPI00222436BE|nr:uncharacterized protein F5J12DRAFT_513407 [Pisolithus orientalis]KAI6015002.1 hypothetical protein F5J12DRAFT_513407 [Pisolithus orientalis]